ncbi:MAG: VanZ family protein [Spongiibacter sp.]
MILRRWQQAALLATYATAITVLSVLPSSSLPSVTLWDKAQHFIAYFLFMVFAYPLANTALTRFLGAVTVLAYSGFIEYLQRLTPNRVPSIEDFIANALGVICAFILMSCVSLFLAARRERRAAKRAVKRGAR